MLLLNHTDTKVRQETDRALRELETGNEKIVRRCLADLDSDKRQRQALARLKTMQLDDAFRSEVAGATFQALLNMQNLPGSIQDAVQLADECEPTAVDRKMIGAFVTILRKPGADSARAGEVLAALGPIAESQVAAALDTSNHATQINACYGNLQREHLVHLRGDFLQAGFVAPADFRRRPAVIVDLQQSFADVGPINVPLADVGEFVFLA